MSKHTPGPWQWSDAFTDENNQPVWTLIGTGDGLYGILTCAQDSAPQDLNDEANARLIAAAPELLYVAELVDDVSDRIDHDPDSAFGQLVAAARAAIAKATGGAQ